ncbi:polyubiquitin-like [Girardinichthys multiradiatus]|uniref:polyubiquitin-like n=1 Tax=Girardinichthys multiradiatus TaxID=208333 RepID=UPI001FAB3AEA|nr:polyubiquitin-like [Girardinichthys multiradiatus]XP_047236936.1 polyubiquitin-like [Girardinichthys multiradiatus]
MEIVITMLNGTSRTLTVNPHDTVGSLKMRIQEQLGFSTATQKLVFSNGINTPLNDDSKTLSFYNLQQGSRVSLLIAQPPTFQVFLKNEKGTNSTYDVKPDETVEIFKRRVQEREGVPVDQQRLIHESREMQGGKLTDYNVRELSTIFLTLRLRGG